MKKWFIRGAVVGGIFAAVYYINQNSTGALIPFDVIGGVTGKNPFWLTGKSANAGGPQ